MFLCVIFMHLANSNSVGGEPLTLYGRWSLTSHVIRNLVRQAGQPA